MDHAPRGLEQLLGMAGPTASAGSTFEARVTALVDVAAPALNVDRSHVRTFACGQDRAPTPNTLPAEMGPVFRDHRQLETRDTPADELDRAIASAFDPGLVLAPRSGTAGSDPGPAVRRSGARMCLVAPCTAGVGVLLTVARRRRAFSRVEEQGLGLVQPELVQAVVGVILSQPSPACAGPLPTTGVLVLGGSGELLQVDDQARQLIASLDPGPHGLPADPLLLALGRFVRQGGAPPEPLALRTRSGGWLNAFALPTEPGTVVLLRATPPAEPAVPIEDLTPRERQVATLAAQGLPQAEIALRLGISLVTAKIHLGRCYRKLGVSGQPELVSRFARATRS